MKTYNCLCGERIFFENTVCINCKRQLGFLPDSLLLAGLDPEKDPLFQPAAGPGNKRYRKCQNYADHGACNWMVSEADQDQAFCVACRLNEIIPDLSNPQNVSLWLQIERAKRRLIYSLLRLGLPVTEKKDDPEGIAFRFLSDEVAPDGNTSHVMTGHDHGIITLNISEADDATRETLRHAMNEPYRTLLGHFRHEIGHYYWDRLVCGTDFLQSYRNLFGDERADYNQALAAYYEKGAPPNWQENFISAYATAHPWEDWAETWAHFLHIQDALEVAHAFGLAQRQLPVRQEGPQGTKDTQGPTKTKPGSSLWETTFDEVVQSWSELAVALNSINRSMGHADLYPFVLSPAVISKLKFVYQVIVSKKPETGTRSMARACNPT